MKKELKSESHLKSAGMITQIKDIRKELNTIKKRQERIVEILEEYELTDAAKKSLKEARATPEEKYISHEDVKK